MGFFTHVITSKMKDTPSFHHLSVYFFPVLLHHCWDRGLLHFFPLKTQRQFFHGDCCLNFVSFKMSFKNKAEGDNILQKYECFQWNRVKRINPYKVNIDKNASSDIKLILYVFRCLINSSFTPSHSPYIH